MTTDNISFQVEIRADSGDWFIAHEGDNLSAADADALVAKLRTDGFTARGVLVEWVNDADREIERLNDTINGLADEYAHTGKVERWEK